MDSRRLLINDVPSSVRDNLVGFVRLHSDLQLLDDCNVVVRRDAHQLASKQVALISGGGSGHEPSHACFIGDGMLTASVSGSIFSSPTASDVLKAIRYVQQAPNSKGVLMIVPNYTGDRLNFGLAKERAVREGYRVEVIFFEDDTAFQGKEAKAGKRGLAGVFFLHKLAGAMAARGADLSFISRETRKAAELIASITISASSCTVPGIGRSFTLPSDTLEVGLGIHGERGVSRIEHTAAAEFVPTMLKYVLGASSPIYPLLKSSGRSPKPQISVLINNLGGLAAMEMNIICKETLEYLQTDYQVKRIYSGSWVGSFDMAGASISIMITDDKNLELLDSPSLTSVFQVIPGSTYFTPNTNIIVDTKHICAEKTPSYVDIFTNTDLYTDCIRAAAKAIIDAKDYLNELDNESGDCDCGSTLATGAEELLAKLDQAKLGASFGQLADVLGSVMGGTSGAIYSLFFTGAENFVRKTNYEASRFTASTRPWFEMLKESISTISKYSYAMAGDRTMIDPLCAIRDVLQSNIDKEWTVDILEQLKSKTLEVTEETATMTAKAGRASYVDSDAVTRPDPGAWAVYLWAREICDLLCNHLPPNINNTM